MWFSRGPAVRKQVLQLRHRRIRLEWCKPRRFRTVDNHWSIVIFSDESIIKVGDRTCTAKKTIQSNHVSKLWYGSITWYGIGTLSFVDGNIDLWPVIVRQFSTDAEIFQDDRTPVLTANIVKTWKRNNGINTLPCPPPPPYSPAHRKLLGSYQEKTTAACFGD